MIETATFPAFLAMAGLAFGAEHALVRVVTSMAADAGGRGLLAVEGTAVTAIALHCSVPVAQSEARVAVVLERRRLPSVFAVATLALGAERALVRVVAPMAADTLAGRRGVTRLAAGTGVAVGAFQVRMALLERETRRRMVEARVLPVLDAVAVFAARPEVAAMRVLGAMAANAIGGCIAVFGARPMALGAGHSAMAVAQDEIGLGVVERSLVKGYDPGVTTPVIGVARPAFPIFQPPMVPAPGAHVGGHVLVAVEA
jgi:hypothetical protein